jgi:hypothetical protein
VVLLCPKFLLCYAGQNPREVQNTVIPTRTADLWCIHSCKSQFSAEVSNKIYDKTQTTETDMPHFLCDESYRTKLGLDCKDINFKRL